MGTTVRSGTLFMRGIRRPSSPRGKAKRAKSASLVQSVSFPWKKRATVGRVIRRLPLLAFVWCMGGYSAVAQAAPSAELEVVGQLTVHTETETTDEGHLVIRGRMNDEVGSPVGGALTVQTQAGKPANVQLCPWLSPESVPSPRKQLESPGTIHVGIDGTFCFVAEEKKGLVLEAQSEHFLKTVHDLDLGRERALSRPRFVQAPATIDLHLEESHIVQILARSESRPPKGASLVLNLLCTEPQLLGESSLEESRLQRFEFRPPTGVRPGTCQLVATVSAPEHKSLSASRSVLLRERIELTVDRTSHESGLFVLAVKAQGVATSRHHQSLDEGLVEAREEGAFVGLGPVRGGAATLEFETNETPRNIELAYVPASSAYLPGTQIVVTVPARGSGFRWASLHTIGLLAFCFWLGYAWLRPKPGIGKGSTIAPPRRQLLHEAGRKSGPISGRVLDAHTGDPLNGMRVALSEVGPEKSHFLEQVTTDSSGAFDFTTRLENHPLLVLSVEGENYMSLSSAARAAELTVHLTLRRRALVHGLVTWARKAGRPWDEKPAATPSSVEKTATERGDLSKAEWARKVAAAAYGPLAPTEGTARALKSPDQPSETPSSTPRAR